MTRDLVVLADTLSNFALAASVCYFCYRFYILVQNDLRIEAYEKALAQARRDDGGDDRMEKGVEEEKKEPDEKDCPYKIQVV